MANKTVDMFIRPVYPFVGLRSMFYMVTPAESMFDNANEVPDYLGEAIPWIFGLMVLENVYLFLRQNKTTYRVNDTITSLGGILLQLLFGRVLIHIELDVYRWLFNVFHMLSLPWNSNWTWFAAFLGVDFFYYWFHRMAHEVALFWAFHQMHHSSEEMNISTTLRQNAFQIYVSFMFYLPLAVLGIPPAVYVVHKFFNNLVMVWIHTESIQKLGPLEYILNTASHHRVHHGRNPYCIDKNYGGTLIIWDRLFGTFAEERDDEKVVFGLLTNVKSFNVIYVHLFYVYEIVVKKLPKMTTWGDRFKALFFPPGWEPGHERLMRCHEHPVPEIEHPVVKYDPVIPMWHNVYTVVHFLIIQALFMQNVSHLQFKLPMREIFLFTCFVIASLQCFGMLFDAKPYAPLAELLRCMFVLVYIGVNGINGVQRTLFLGIFGVSFIAWLKVINHNFTMHKMQMNKKNL